MGLLPAGERSWGAGACGTAAWCPRPEPGCWEGGRVSRVARGTAAYDGGALRAAFARESTRLSANHGAFESPACPPTPLASSGGRSGSQWAEGVIPPQPISLRFLPPSRLRASSRQSLPLQAPGLSPNRSRLWLSRPISAAPSPSLRRPPGGGMAAGGEGGRWRVRHFRCQVAVRRGAERRPRPGVGLREAPAAAPAPGPWVSGERARGG